jgi:hypothetical protein
VVTVGVRANKRGDEARRRRALQESRDARHDRRQRCQRAALAQRSRHMPRVVLAIEGPAEAEHRVRKSRKARFAMRVRVSAVLPILLCFAYE